MLYILIIAVKLILFLSSNFISLPQEVSGIFVIKAAVHMQNNLPFYD
jgi:hypothetical protein